MRLVPAFVALALVIASPAVAAAPRTLTAHSGGVTATVTWTEDAYSASDVRLAIERAGETVLDEPLLDKGAPTRDIPQSLRVRDLDGDGEPEVILDLYTGGAHCCLYSVIEHFDPAGDAYGAFRHDWGDLGYTLKDLDGDGRPEFRSADDHFAYEFTSFAGSAFPIQIWTYGAGELDDMTRSYPKLIQKDAARLWKGYLKERDGRDADVRGILAAWAADEYLLYDHQTALHGLQKALKRGDLKGFGPWPSGKKYIRELKKFLDELGYSHLPA